MKHRELLSLFVVGLLVSSVTESWAEARAFDRYEIILTRRPFGEPPAEPQPSPIPAVPAGPSFIETIRLVALTISEGDVRVGFMDTRPNPPKTYFLFVGESQDGIEVVSADYENESAVLRKAGEERSIRMSSRSGGGGTAASLARGGARGTPRSSSSSQAGRTVTPRRISAARQARIDERRRRAETMPALHGAVLEKHLQEYNMQAIREGAPPLPIPLTAEQDAQLVAEGILPPLE